MRLIDADDLEDVVTKLNEQEFGITRNEFKRIELVISEFPTVEAEPIRHGHWEWVDTSVYGNPYGSYKCDCGNYMPHKTNYCPNCGARMREVTE